MPPLRHPLKARPAGNDIDTPTKHYSSTDQVYTTSADRTNQTSGAAGSPKPPRCSTPTSPIAYCSPGSLPPFSIYNFIPAGSRGPVQSASFDKSTNNDMRKLPTATVENGNDMPFAISQFAPRQQAGQLPALPSPVRLWPQPRLEPRQQTRSQGQDLYHCPDCSGAPVQEAEAYEQQQHESLPVYVLRGAKWVRETSPEAISDSDSSYNCSTACSCFYDADAVSADGSTVAVSEESGPKSEQQPEILWVTPLSPPSSEDHGDKNNDAEYCCCSDSSSASGDWVDVVPAHRQHEDRQEQQQPSSHGSSSLSRSSPQPPPPPPPSPRRHRGGHGCDSGDGRDDDAEMRRRPQTPWPKMTEE